LIQRGFTQRSWINCSNRAVFKEGLWDDRTPWLLYISRPHDLLTEYLLKELRANCTRLNCVQGETVGWKKPFQGLTIWSLNIFSRSWVPTPSTTLKLCLRRESFRMKEPLDFDSFFVYYKASRSVDWIYPQGAECQLHPPRSNCVQGGNLVGWKNPLTLILFSYISRAHNLSNVNILRLAESRLYSPRSHILVWVSLVVASLTFLTPSRLTVFMAIDCF